MDAARYDQILREVCDMHVRIHADPRTQGSGYVSSKICEVNEAVDKVNGFAQEVEVALARSRNELRDFELESKMFFEAAMMELMETEGYAYQEKVIKARAEATRKIKDKRIQESMEAGNPITEVDCIDKEIVALKKEEENLRALKTMVDEKRAQLKATDSQIRLQNTSIETEMRMFGGAPVPQNNRGRGRTPTGAQQQDNQWSELTAQRAET